VCVATALAHDVHDCIPAAYATVDRVKFPNRIVRSDIGARLEKQLPKLHSLGFEEMPLW
jgi:phosphoribosylamine-glycine ligase